MARHARPDLDQRLPACAFDHRGLRRRRLDRLHPAEPKHGHDRQGAADRPWFGGLHGRPEKLLLGLHPGSAGPRLGDPESVEVRRQVRVRRPGAARHPLWRAHGRPRRREPQGAEVLQLAGDHLPVDGRLADQWRRPPERSALCRRRVAAADRQLLRRQIQPAADAVRGRRDRARLPGTMEQDPLLPRRAVRRKRLDLRCVEAVDLQRPGRHQHADREDPRRLHAVALRLG
jgi:hypothetical protein